MHVHTHIYIHVYTQEDWKTGHRVIIPVRIRGGGGGEGKEMADGVEEVGSSRFVGALDFCNTFSVMQRMSSRHKRVFIKL